MHEQPNIKLSDCWAKTDPATGKPALTVRDHSLIAAVVAHMVIERLPLASRSLAPAGSATLVGLHDIGKITPGFLRRASNSHFAAFNGWQAFCGDHSLVGQEFLASLPGLQHPDKNPFQLSFAVGGHHGRYPATKIRNNLTKPGGPNEGNFQWPDALRRELLAEILDIAGPLPSSDLPKGAKLHWLTGLIVFCDWIASNTDWFPLKISAELQNTWTPESAQASAATAIEMIGWHRREVKSGLSFPECFGSPEFLPTPLQETTMDLVDEPGLYIIEAPMGTGKTEAALAAAYQRWTTGDERGLYFALPTQLTSNRIHDRIATFLDRVVAGQTIQTLVHGNAWLSEDRARSFSPSSTPGESSDATEACRWFASGRKSLLAPFGTGTIDQALMSVLSAKHSALRLFALSGKVVVIDEVHSYDPYTSTLVDRLVAWLREVGCTVIILSATLTAARRRSLVAAAGTCEPEPPPTAYPLITKVVGNHASHHQVPGPPPDETCVRIETIPLAQEDALLEKAAAAASAGACVLIIRNTVALAQETYRRIKEAVKGEHIEIGLIHSRFPHNRRMVNEGHWTDILGKSPGTARPAGSILVATQVVEQSVDIDADLLFTDLAPTDLILQRLGRLHRHARNRPKGFENPKAYILIPQVDWESDDPKSTKAACGPSAWIYPPITLFHAECLWREIGSVSLPSSIRSLLETPLPSPLPPAAAYFAEELERETRNMRSKAAHQDVFRTPSEDDKEGSQTRYNIKPTAMIVVLNAMPERRPPVFDYDLAKRLHENAARVPGYLVKRAIAHQPAWFTAQIDNAVLAIRRPDSAELIIEGEQDLDHRISYRDDLGITFEKIPNASASRAYEPEDDWF